MDYRHYTHEELLRVVPSSKLESELQMRLDCVLARVSDLSHMEQKYEVACNDKEDYQQTLESLKSAIKPIATEIHRCAFTGIINITPQFIDDCNELIYGLDELCEYEYPKDLEDIYKGHPGFPMEHAPKDGSEVILQVKKRAGIEGKFLVGHYMQGGFCIDDHPAIVAGWYFWNGCAFDRAAEPIRWWPLPSKEV